MYASLTCILKLKIITIPDCVKIHFGKYFKIPDRNLTIYKRIYSWVLGFKAVKAITVRSFVVHCFKFTALDLKAHL